MKSGKLPIAIIYLLSLVSFHVKAEGERAAWLEERRETIEQAKANPSAESLEKLGLLVSGLGREKNLSPDVEKIFSEAKEALISIPNHADYFGDKIKAITDAEIARTSTAHGSQRGWYFETLNQLQSPETVRVLGELLFDERNPFKNIQSDTAWVPSCYYAEGALFKLGLQTRPVTGPYIDYEGDLHTWQLWYQQVRAGTRTFSFKGDDKVYTLAGPVTETPQPAPSSPKPEASSVTPPIAAAPLRPKWPLAVALVAAAAGLFVIFRKAKKQSPSQ